MEELWRVFEKMEKRRSGVTNCTNGIKVVQITQGDVSATKWVLDRELIT